MGEGKTSPFNSIVAIKEMNKNKNIETICVLPIGNNDLFVVEIKTKIKKTITKGQPVYCSKKQEN